MLESWREGIACEACWQANEDDWARQAHCGKCDARLPPVAAYLQVSERQCGQCRDFAFSFARACGAYNGALRESVLWLKEHPQLAPRLCGLLRATFDQQSVLRESEMIVPIPLHPDRFAERTFNQAELIADVLAAHAGLRAHPSCLLRAKATELHRAGMGATERARSLHKAFRVYAPRLLKNRVVLVVDDVMTTGSTAQEAAQTLLAGGAKAVNVLTLARAVSLFG
jgi:ComF family protein